MLVDILFRQVATFINVQVSFLFGLQTLQLIDFSKIFQLKGLKPKNKRHTNFYECCDFTKKYGISNANIYKKMQEFYIKVASKK